MSKGLNYLQTVVRMLPLATPTPPVTTPKVSDWTGVGVKAIDPYLLDTSKLPAYGADKVVTEMGIDESVDIEAITGSTASGWFLDFFFDYVAATGIASTSDLRTVFSAPGLAWAMLIRNNKPFDTALAIGDKVDIYQVTSGRVQKVRDFKGYFKGKVELHNMAALAEDVTMVA